jgi:hypothetical protein
MCLERRDIMKRKTILIIVCVVAAVAIGGAVIRHMVKAKNGTSFKLSEV